MHREYKYRKNHSRNPGKENTISRLGRKFDNNFEKNVRDICNGWVWIRFM